MDEHHCEHGNVVLTLSEDDKAAVGGTDSVMRFSDDSTDAEVTASDLGAEIPKSIYFGGCCWGASFYVGVYRAMWERWGPDFRHKCLITGDSAGSVFAVGIALGRTPDQMCELYRTMSEKASKNGFLGTVGGFMDEHLRAMLNQYPNAYRELEGKLKFGVTVFPFKHVWHDRWDSNEHLLDECRCSYHMPIYCGRPPSSIHGYVVDGAYGMAGHDMPHGCETLFIGIDPHAEVTREFTNSQMFYPALGDDYNEIVKSGYDAFMNWKGHRLRKVGSRTANYDALYVLWVLKVLEIIHDIFEFFFLTIPGAVYSQTCSVISGGKSAGSTATATAPSLTKSAPEALERISSNCSDGSLSYSEDSTNSSCSSPSVSADAIVSTEEHIARVLETTS